MVDPVPNGSSPDTLPLLRVVFHLKQSDGVKSESPQPELLARTRPRQILVIRYNFAAFHFKKAIQQC
jgi:hypothetical protein